MKQRSFNRGNPVTSSPQRRQERSPYLGQDRPPVNRSPDRSQRVGSQESSDRQYQYSPQNAYYRSSPMRTQPSPNLEQRPNRPTQANQFISTHIKLKKLVRKILGFINFSSDALNRQKFMGSGLLSSQKELMDELIQEKNKLQSDLQQSMGAHDSSVSSQFGNLEDAPFENANLPRLQELLAEVAEQIITLVSRSPQGYELSPQIEAIFDKLACEIQNDFTASEPEIQKLEDERKNLEQQHKLYMEKLTSRITEKHRNDKRKIQVLVKEKGDLEHKVERFHRELNSLQIASDAKDNLIQTLEKRTRFNAPLQKEHGFQEELRQTKMEMSELQKKLNKSMATIVNKDREIEAMNQNLLKIRTESNESANLMNDRLKTMSMSQQPSNDRKMGKMKAKMATLRQEIETMRKNTPPDTIQKLQNTVLSMETERYRLKKELEEEKRVINHYTHELEQLNTKMANKDDYIAQLTSDAESEVNHLKEQLSDVDKKFLAKISSNASMIEDIEHLNTAIASKDNLIYEMQEQLKQHQKASLVVEPKTPNKDMQKLRDEIVELTKAVQHRDEELEMKRKLLSQIEAPRVEPAMLSNLKKALSDSEIEIEALRESNDELNKRFRKKLEENGIAHKKQLSQLQEESQSIRDENNNLMVTLSELKDTVADSDIEKGNLKRDVDLLRQKLATSEQSVESLENQLKQFDKSNKDIVSCIRKVNQGGVSWVLMLNEDGEESWMKEEDAPSHILVDSIECDPTIHEFQELADKFSTLQDEIAAKSTYLSDYEEFKVESIGKLTKKREKLRAVRVQHQEAKNSEVKITNELNEKKQDVDDLLAVQQKLESKLQTQVTSHADATRDLKFSYESLVEAKTAEIKKLKEQSEEQFFRISGFEEKLEKQKEKLRGAEKAKVKENLGTNKKLEDAYEQISDLMGQLEELKTKIQGKDDAINELTEEIEELEQKFSQSWEKNSDTLSEMIQKLKEEKDVSQKLQDALEEKEYEIEQWEAEREKIAGQIQEFTDKAGKLRLQKQELSKQLETATEKNDKMAAELSESKSTLGELQQSILNDTQNHLEAIEQLSHAQTQSEKESSNVAKLAHENELVSTQLAKVEENYEQLLTNVQSLSAEMGIEAEEFFEAQKKVHEQNVALSDICKSQDAIINAIGEKLGTQDDHTSAVQLLIDDKNLLVANATALENERKEAVSLCENLDSNVKLLTALKGDSEKEIKELKMHSTGLEELLQEREGWNLNLESRLKNMTLQMEESATAAIKYAEQIEQLDVTIDDLKKDLEKAKEDVAALQWQLEVSEQSTDAISEELKVAKEKIEKLNKENQTVTTEYEAVDTKLARKREKLNDARSGRLSGENRISLLETNFSELSTQNSDLQSRLQNMTIATQESSTKVQQDFATQMNELTQANTDLKVNLDEEKSKTKELQSQLGAQQDESSKLYKGYDKQMNELTQANTELQENLDDEKSKTTDLSSQLGGLQEESNKSKKDHDTQMNELIQANTELKENLDEEKSIAKELYGQLEKLQQDVKEAYARVSMENELSEEKLSALDVKLGTKREKLQAVREENKKSDDKIGNLEKINENLEKQNANLESNLQNLTTTTQESSTKEQQAFATQMNEITQANTELKAKLDEEKSRADYLEHQLSALEDKVLDDSALDKLQKELDARKLNEIEIKLGRKREKLQAARGSNQQGEDKIGSLENRYKFLKTQNQDLESRLQNMSIATLESSTKAQQDFATQMNELTQANTNLKANLDKEKQRSEALQREIDEKEGELADAQKNIEQIKGSHAEAAQGMSGIEGKLGRKREKLRDLRSKDQEREQHLSNMTQEMEENAEKCAVMFEKAEELDDQVVSLTEENETLKNSTKELSEYVNAKSQEVLELGYELGKTKEALEKKTEETANLKSSTKKTELQQAQTIDTLNQDIEDMTEQHTKALNVANVYSAEIDSLKKQIKDKNVEAQDLQDKNDQLSEQLSDKETQASTTLSSTVTKLQDKNVKIEDLESQLSEVQVTLSSLYTTSADKEAEQSDKILQLKTELDEIKSTKSEASEANSDLNRKIKGLEVVLTANQDALNQKREKYGKLKVDAGELRNALDKSETKGTQLSEQLTNYSEKLAENDQTIEDKESELASQKEKLLNLTQAKNDSEAQLNSLLRAQDQQIEQLQNQLASAGQNLAEKEANIQTSLSSSNEQQEQYSARIKSLDSEKERLGAQVQTLESKIDAKRKKIQNLRDDLVKTQEDHEEESDQLNQERAIIEEALAEFKNSSEQTLKIKEGEINRLTIDISKLQHAVRENEKTVKQLKELVETSKDMIQNYQKKNKTLETDKKASVTAMSSLTAKVDKKRAKAKTARTQLDEATTKSMADIEASLKTIEDNEEEIFSLKQKILDLEESQLSSSNVSSEQVANVNAELEELKNKLQQNEVKRKTFEDYEDKLQTQQATISEKLEEIARMDEEITNLKEQLLDQESALALKEKEYQDSYRSMTSEQESKDEEKLQEMTQLVDDLDGQLADLRKKYNNGKERVEELQNETYSLMAENSAKQTDIDLIRKKLSSSEKNVDRLQAELENKLEEYNYLTDQIDELNDFKDRYDTLLSKLQFNAKSCGYPTDIDTYFAAVMDTKARIDDLQEKESEDMFNMSGEGVINFSSLSMAGGKQMPVPDFSTCVKRVAYEGKKWCLVEFPTDEEGIDQTLWWWGQEDLLEQQPNIRLPDIDPDLDSLKQVQASGAILENKIQELTQVIFQVEEAKNKELDRLSQELASNKQVLAEFTETLEQIEVLVPGKGDLPNRIERVLADIRAGTPPRPPKDVKPVPLTVDAVNEEVFVSSGTGHFSSSGTPQVSQGEDEIASASSFSDITSATPAELQSLVSTVKKLVRENEELENTIQLQENQLKLLNEERLKTEKKLQSENISANLDYLKELFHTFAGNLPQLKNEAESVLRVICSIFEYTNAEMEEIYQKRGLTSNEKPAPKKGLLKSIFSKRKKK